MTVEGPVTMPPIDHRPRLLGQGVICLADWLIVPGPSALLSKQPFVLNQLARRISPWPMGQHDQLVA